MNKKIAVIGLGYIGLPMVAAFSNVGFEIIGIDIDKKRIDSLRKGIVPLYEPGVKETLKRNKKRITYTTKYNTLKNVDAILITVGTPLDCGTPTMKYVHAAINKMAPHIKGKILILKSTVEIGTTRKVKQYIEEKHNLKIDKDYHLAFCPERTIEGLALHELYTLTKIVGGMSKQSSKKCSEIVGKLGGKVICVSKPEAAEISKLIDNNYRALQIAFANELGDICETLKINCNEVVSTVNEAYERTHIFKPGLGAAGPCLIKDPQILDLSSDGILIEAMIESNERRNLKLLELIFQNFGKKKFKIAYVGLTFKGFPETDDLRNSPSLMLRYLINTHFNVDEIFYDPLVKQLNKSIKVKPHLDEEIYSAECIILLTNHPQYKGIELNKVKKNTLIIDCWNNLRLTKEVKKAKIFKIGEGYK